MIFMVNFDSEHSDDDFKYRINSSRNSKCSNPNIIMTQVDDSHSPNNYLSEKFTNFITFHQNIRGLTHKTDELLISLSSVNPQVLCVTEHHL